MNTITLSKIEVNLQARIKSNQPGGCLELIDEVAEIIVDDLEAQLSRAIQSKDKHYLLFNLWKLKLKPNSTQTPIRAVTTSTTRIKKRIDDNKGKVDDKSIVDFKDLLTKQPEHLSFIQRIIASAVSSGSYSAEVEIPRNMLFIVNSLFEEISIEIYRNKNKVKITSLGTFYLSNSDGKGNVGYPTFELDKRFESILNE
jgi:hypothetical protein